MTCEHCGHERFYHFVLDEQGHEEQCPCAEFFGSGRFRCNCTEYEEAA